MEGYNMIKNISKLTLMLLLICCLLPCQAFAYGYIDSELPLPDEYFAPWDSAITPWDSPVTPWDGGAVISGAVSTPIITKEPDPFMAARGDVPGALRVEASSYDNGFLCYQWYISYSGNNNELFTIDGAYSNVYTPEQILGTVYYCVGVYNVVADQRSEEIRTGLVPVSHSGIEITQAPYNLNYKVGSSVDLSGLTVNVYDGFSGSWQSVNGSGLNVYPSVLQNAGKVAVEVSYNGSSDVFYVNVGNGTGKTSAKNGGNNAGISGDGSKSSDGSIAPDGSHVHSFSEWEVTQPATCITTGLESRSCECGETETQEIPRTDHAWDEGVITKEPTETSNGARLYTCTICKANKSEIIPAVKVSASPADVAAQTASLNINGGDPEASGNVNNNGAVTGTVDTTRTGANEAANVSAGNVKKNDSSGWWLIPVSALVLVGTGTGAYYIMRKKGSQQ